MDLLTVREAAEWLHADELPLPCGTSSLWKWYSWQTHRYIRAVREKKIKW